MLFHVIYNMYVIECYRIAALKAENSSSEHIENCSFCGKSHVCNGPYLQKLD